VACLTVIAWIAVSSGSVYPRKCVSLSSNCHISVCRVWADDAGLVFFNDAGCGPYTGSIIEILGPQGQRGANSPNITGFGDTAGIYYRYIIWPDGRKLWTLLISLRYPLILALPMPLIWLVRNYRRRKMGRGFPLG